MTEQFDISEKLFRAVYPPDIMPLFWKENGNVSSAVFKDKKGLSVERSGGRGDNTVINNMRLYFCGSMVSVFVGDCMECEAVIRFLPTVRSEFHSEIHGSNERKLLSQSQCKFLADRAKVYTI